MVATTGVMSAVGGSAEMRLSIETTTGTDRIGAGKRRGLRLSHAGTRARVATMDCVRRGVSPAGGLLSPRITKPRAGPCDVASERRPSEDCRLHTCESGGR